MAFEANNLEPSAAPEKWADERAPAASGANVKSTVEEIESQAWLDSEPAPEPEPEETPDDAPVIEEPTTELETPEPEAAALAPKAQQRFQQLANDNRELKEHLAQMRSIMERQTKAEEQRAEQERSWAAKAAQQEVEQQQAAAKQQYDQWLLSQGQDPNAPANMAAFAAIQQTGALNRELAALKQQQAATANQQAVNNYVSAMNGHVDEVLSAYAVNPKQVAAVKRASYAIAQAQQIQNPHDAVKQALEAFSDDNGNLALPKKGAAKAAPKASKTQPVDAMIAARGSRGDAEKGQLANGKRPKKSLEQIENDMGAGKWR